MLLNTLHVFFNRDLHKLKKEIESYKNEERIWHTEKSIPNSAGNLCLHVVGNLNTFIGAAIGKTGYVRNRELEFSAKGIDRNTLVRMIDETISTVDTALKNVAAADLEKEFPMAVFEEKITTEHLLVHLATHLTYHLGQINYHRRLLDE